MTLRPAARWLLAGLLAGVGGSPAVRAEHPTTASLLPETTTALLWIPSAPDAGERFMNTALGRICRDPQIRPLVNEFFRSLAESVDKSGLGVPLSELWALPDGELALAVVASEEDAASLVILMDTGDQVLSARRLLDRMSRGPGRAVTKVFGTTVLVHEGVGSRQRQIVVFEKDGTVVVATNMEVLKGVLAAWNGQGRRTLAKNETFRAIMRRSREQNPKPQFAWYVDPIMWLQFTGQKEPRLQMALAMLPVLGLDGLKAAGGATELDAGSLDSIVHAHLLMEKPRRGILKMLAFAPVSTTPEPWIPADVSTYTTLNWDVRAAFDSVKELFDSFRGQGALSEVLTRWVEQVIGLDFEHDLLPALTGRLTYFTRVERSAAARGRGTLLAWELKREADVGRVLEKMIRGKGGIISRRSFAGKTYFEFSTPGLGQEDTAGRSMAEMYFGLVDRYLIIADRASLYETVIATANGSSERLADAPDFKRIADEIGRRSGGAKPAMVRFARPEEDMRWIYDVVASEQTRQLLSEQAERNMFSRALNSALQSGALPPFSLLESYLAPGGALMTVDDEGLHYTGFTLRRNWKSP